jgi:GNAT superfamily N-acetyltransferase
MENDLLIRPMVREELDVLVDWAANEGWNPGKNDADIFWNTDPDGFIAAELDNELIGGGSIVSYGGRFGFMGFFIVKPEWRSRGLGRQLWNFRKERLLSRLDPGAAIGMDGVFDMQPFYAQGGFEFFGRDLRYEGVGAAGKLHPGLVEAKDVPFDKLLEYDARHFPAPRPRFIEQWLQQPESRSLVMVSNGEIRGYGMVRACRQGFKIGPLFAADTAVAEALFNGLSDNARGQPLFLDTPEINPDAVKLARNHGMQEVFGCARMYLGAPPDLPHRQIFGVTTFELG